MSTSVSAMLQDGDYGEDNKIINSEWAGKSLRLRRCDTMLEWQWTVRYWSWVWAGTGEGVRDTRPPLITNNTVLAAIYSISSFETKINFDRYFKIWLPLVGVRFSALSLLYKYLVRHKYLPATSSNQVSIITICETRICSKSRYIIFLKYFPGIVVLWS